MVISGRQACVFSIENGVVISVALLACYHHWKGDTVAVQGLVSLYLSNVGVMMFDKNISLW